MALSDLMGWWNNLNNLVIIAQTGAFQSIVQSSNESSVSSRNFGRHGCNNTLNELNDYAYRGVHLQVAHFSAVRLLKRF